MQFYTVILGKRVLFIFFGIFCCSITITAWERHRSRFFLSIIFFHKQSIFVRCFAAVSEFIRVQYIFLIFLRIVAAFFHRAFEPLGTLCVFKIFRKQK